MKIAVIAHIRHAIAEPFMGGMEAHSAMLCEGLRRAGHDVTLFAAEGSQDEKLVPVCDEPYDKVLPWNVWRGSLELARYQKRAFTRAWNCIVGEQFDVVHNNSLYPQIMDWAVRDRMPCVTSQHVPPFETMRDTVMRSIGDPITEVTVTSRAQAQLWPELLRRELNVVHNGVRCEQWVPHDSVQDHFVWVGRITSNKGTAHAVQAALRTDVPLHIYGPVEDVRYFAEEIEPFLNGKIQYHGHRTAAQLRPALAQAKAALVTPLWEEPFGLVAAEALSCGTPVCAYNSGALREVVGDCGLVVPPKDVAALARAMGKIEEIHRNACRQRALTLFSVETMIERYEDVYRCAIDGLLNQAASAFASRYSRTTALLA